MLLNEMVEFQIGELLGADTSVWIGSVVALVCADKQI